MASFPRSRYAAQQSLLPSPCQTISRKAEFTCKSGDAILWTPHHAPRSSANKRRSWASDSEDDEDKEATVAPLEEPTTPPAPQHYNSSRSPCTEHQTSTTSQQPTRPPSSPRKRELAERRKGERRDSGRRSERKEHPVVLRVMKRPCDGAVDGHEIAESAAIDHLPVSELATTDIKNHELKAAAAEREIPEPYWANDTDLNDTEKERRRQVRAMEQQQLILQQVAAARRCATKAKSAAPKVSIAQHSPTTTRTEDSETRDARIQHQQKRQPRTKGFLFMRLSNGKVVRVDRHGELFLPREANKYVHDEEPEDGIAEEGSAKEDPARYDNPDEKKAFVPAPIPKVSAWTQGSPLLTNGSDSNDKTTEPHQGINGDSEENGIFGSGHSEKQELVEEKKTTSRQHFGKGRKTDRRPGRGGSFRSKTGTYQSKQ